jgi:hypothetical protein
LGPTGPGMTEPWALCSPGWLKTRPKASATRRAWVRGLGQAICRHGPAEAGPDDDGVAMLGT